MMSSEMQSQGSDQESEYEQSDQEDDFLCYYNNDVNDLDIDKPKSDDTEQFDYELLTVEDVERLLNEEVEYLCSAVHVSNSPFFFFIFFLFFFFFPNLVLYCLELNGFYNVKVP